jgi:hypothetical protein
MDYDP